MSGAHDRVAGLRGALEARRPLPRQPVRRHPLMRWLRSPILGGRPARRGAPSPFMQGLADGRREGLDEGYRLGYSAGYTDGQAAGEKD